MGVFVDKLADVLKDIICTGVSVTELRKRDQGYQLRLDNGAMLQADHVILSTPAYVSAALLRGEEPELASRLDAIPYLSTATVSLAYHKDNFPIPKDGTG